MPDAPKKVLIVAENQVLARYVATALEYKHIQSDIRVTSGTHDLAEATQHIKDHGSDYQGVMLMNLATFEIARKSSDSIPNMYDWARDVKNSVPTVMVWDDIPALDKAELLRLKTEGIDAYSSAYDEAQMDMLEIADIMAKKLAFPKADRKLG